MIFPFTPGSRPRLKEITYVKVIHTLTTLPADSDLFHAKAQSAQRKKAKGKSPMKRIDRQNGGRVFLFLLVFGQAYAQTDPLPSWNDGAAKKAIVEFVKTTTEKGSPKFVAPEERIATFDQDGTLWVEHPMYSFVMYALERVPELAKAKPELKNVEPFKTVLSGNREAMAKLTLPDVEKIVAATFTGMSVDRVQP